MSTGFFNLKKALQVFGLSPEELTTRGISETALPAFARSPSDNRSLKSWSYSEMPSVGAHVGFMKKPSAPMAIAIFVTKGGVLKSSLTLNLARMAALHGLRTCVVGLDMQGDITTALSSEEPADDNISLKDAIAKMNSLRGLADVYNREAKIEDVILPTDLPTLFYIPETPELVNLDQSLMARNRREYWLRDEVITPLKANFDLILMDCSPNWNRLITNALVACDVLVSPLECKINNFRNFKTFRALLQEFKEEMQSDFKQVFVPTRLSPSRKLSREIFGWYQEHLSECTKTALRESVQGEEATAVRISIPEYAPTSAAADEMRELVREVWSAISGHESARDLVDLKNFSERGEACL
jgi:chromosome partitioning protein